VLSEIKAALTDFLTWTTPRRQSPPQIASLLRRVPEDPVSGLLYRQYSKKRNASSAVEPAPVDKRRRCLWCARVSSRTESGHFGSALELEGNRSKISISAKKRKETSMKIRPLQDRVIVKRIARKKDQRRHHHPGTAKESARGKVVAVAREGQRRRKLTALDVKVGDRSSSASTRQRNQTHGEEHLIMPRRHPRRDRG